MTLKPSNNGHTAKISTNEVVKTWLPGVRSVMDERNAKNNGYIFNRIEGGIKRVEALIRDVLKREGEAIQTAEQRVKVEDKLKKESNRIRKSVSLESFNALVKEALDSLHDYLGQTELPSEADLAKDTPKNEEPNPEEKDEPAVEEAPKTTWEERSKRYIAVEAMCDSVLLRAFLKQEATLAPMKKISANDAQSWKALINACEDAVLEIAVHADTDECTPESLLKKCGDESTLLSGTVNGLTFDEARFRSAANAVTRSLTEYLVDFKPALFDQEEFIQLISPQSEIQSLKMLASKSAVILAAQKEADDRLMRELEEEEAQKAKLLEEAKADLLKEDIVPKAEEPQPDDKRPSSAETLPDLSIRPQLAAVRRTLYTMKGLLEDTCLRTLKDQKKRKFLSNFWDEVERGLGKLFQNRESVVIELEPFVSSVSALLGSDTLLKIKPDCVKFVSEEWKKKTRKYAEGLLPVRAALWMPPTAALNPTAVAEETAQEVRTVLQTDAPVAETPKSSVAEPKQDDFHELLSAWESGVAASKAPPEPAALPADPLAAPARPHPKPRPARCPS
jgi:hypothetical protein